MTTVGATVAEKCHHPMSVEMDEKKNPSNDQSTPSRDQWGGEWEFLLACLGNAVGLGNCWRFPYFCYKNGGGAFLLPYAVCCLIIGLPLFLIELGLGQFSAMGPAHLYANLSPLFRGVGIASVISSALTAIYYNMILGWTLFYSVETFLGEKWNHCDNWFNTKNCRKIGLQTSFNGTGYSMMNNSLSSSSSSTEEFFNNYVLTKSDGLETLTLVNWKLVLALFVGWALVALSLMKGIQSSGKVVYFTATFPYIILSVLLFRGLALPGSLNGLHYYITPNWTRINEVEVWRDAAVQVIYSFGIGGGGMITYASYNRFNNPLTKHALLVGFGDFFTSIFCGAVVFTMLGYMSTALNKPIDSIVQSGTGLAFIVIPEGLSQMPFSQIWSLLFFFMLFLLGIDSQFAMVETVLTFLFDQMREKKIEKINKPLVVTVASILWFILGLPLCTDSGIYILNLMDSYVAGIPSLLIGLIEILIITFIYGIDRFLENIRLMTSWQPGILIRSNVVVMISVVAPSVISFILYKEICHLFDPESTTLKYGSYQYPVWAEWLGWSLVSISIIAIPFFMIYQMLRALFSHLETIDNNQQQQKNECKSFVDCFKSLVHPTSQWWDNSRKFNEDNFEKLEMEFNENHSNTVNENLKNLKTLSSNGKMPNSDNEQQQQQKSTPENGREFLVTKF